MNTDMLDKLFGELKDDKLRLSIEGSQIVGPSAKKNIIELLCIEFSRGRFSIQNIVNQEKIDKNVTLDLFNQGE